MHSFRLHHDCKIDTASFKEGKRPPHPRSEEEADDKKPGHPLARSTAWWISQRQQQGARSQVVVFIIATSDHECLPTAQS